MSVLYNASSIFVVYKAHKLVCLVHYHSHHKIDYPIENNSN